MKRDLVDELYKTAYKRYREKYPNKDFVSIPNFLDSLWFSIEGELNRNGYNVTGHDGKMAVKIVEVGNQSIAEKRIIEL